MPIHTALKRFIPLAALPIVAGCAGAVTGAQSAASCSIGSQCQLTGTLAILRGMPASAGTLDTDEGCIPLALPPDIYREFRSWNNQNVVVSGEGFAPSGAADIAWVELKDRKVATGVCNSAPVIVYVTRIRKR